MIHLPPLITDLGLILAAAGLITLIFKWLKQPLVLGYIIAGVLVGPHFSLFPTVTDEEGVKVWAEIGVIFLLFSLGLEFSFKKLVKVGAPASITAVFEVVFMLVTGYVTGILLGWSQMDSIFLGGILSISSTTIIIRAFEELKVKTQKFAGLVFGVLIVEDLVAILILVLLSTLAVSFNFSSSELLISMGKLSFFLILWFIAGIFLIPTFLRRVKKLMNDETMLIVSLALCLLMVIVAVQAGFSQALGAFIMGSILAETVYAEKIEHLIKPVKDLFAAIFFVSVGMLIDPAMLLQYIVPVLIITLITISGKLFSSMTGALLAGQQLKHSIQAGMSLAQIGEFSFIIATLGLTLGVTSEFLYPIAVAISAITTFTTPYMMRLSLPVYNLLQKVLPERLIAALNRYSSGTQTINTSSDWRNFLRAYLSSTVLNSVVLVSVILLNSQLLYPFLKREIINSYWGTILSAGISLLVMLPFLWGLAGKRIKPITFSKLILGKRTQRGPLIILEILRVGLGVFFLFILLSLYFEVLIALAFTVITAILAALYFQKRLNKFYSTIENRFIKNLNSKEEETKAPKAITSDMIPWDGHIAEFLLTEHSPLVGKTLEELRLREKYGVNIAMIERGERDIHIPQRNERLYPGDILSVIGTDEQFQKFREEIESAEYIPNEVSEEPVILLQKINIGANSLLLNKSIRESGIREKAKALIVGIERGNERTLNPESDFVFQKGDVVWMVGNKDLIKRFIL